MGSMKLEDVLDLCTRRGVTLGLHGDQLKVRASRGALDPQITGVLRDHKHLLLEWLRRPTKASTAITRADRGAPLPVSFSQQRLWFIDQLEGAGQAYHIVAAVRLHGMLEVSALQAALNTMWERHEALRTVFASVEGSAIQVIQPPSQFRLQQIDLSDLAVHERE